MKWKPISLFIFTLMFFSCDKEDAPDCFKTTGSIIQKEVFADEFEELIVYGRTKLYIEQGEEQKVVIESGENLISDISVEVIDGRLILKNNISCNLFREYDVTSVYVTVPNLTWLQNAGSKTIEGVGELNFPVIWLRSFNQEKDPEIYTNGDFRLHLNSESIRITGDDFSNFFLRGTTGYLDAYFAAGDGRLEAAELIAETVEIQHRGTNKLIVNPQQVLKGEIRSTGDVISVTRPPVVRVETFYLGELYFQEN